MEFCKRNDRPIFEMKQHLLQRLEELKKVGNTEEESLKIAFDQFGDKQMEGGLVISFSQKRNL